MSRKTVFLGMVLGISLASWPTDTKTLLDLIGNLYWVGSGIFATYLAERFNRKVTP